MPTVGLDALTVNGSAESLSVELGINIDALMLSASAQSLSVSPGVTLRAMDALLLNIIPLDLQLILPVCSLSARHIDFGDVDVDGSKDMTLRITNTKSGTLSGTVSISAGSAYFSILESDLSYSLDAGEYADFTVRFELASGSLPGIYTGTLDTGSAPCEDVSLTATAEYPTTMVYFRYAEGESDEVTVYLRKAVIAPHSIAHELPEMITRTEDKKLKVYEHSLAGSKKRIWQVTAYMTDRDIEDYRWLDLEAFFWETIHGAREQFTFRDNFDQSYTVRMVRFGPLRFETRDWIKIRMVLEEDYA